MSQTDPVKDAPWLPAEAQVAPQESFAAGRNPIDVRTEFDLTTGIYTDLDTGEVRTWFQQKMYIQSRMMGYAHTLAKLRQVGSDMQALWGRKPVFRDDWFGGYIPEYREPNPRVDLRRLQATYGGDPPWPPGPMPGGY